MDGGLRVLAAWAWGLAGVGCYSGAASDAEPQADSGDAGDDGDDDDDAESDGGADGPDGAANGSPGVRLLSRREYRNSVRDLLGVTLPLEDIPQEHYSEGHGSIASAQGAGLSDVEQYYELGLLAAQQFVTTQEVGCNLSDRACAETFANDLITRAFRRPVPDDFSSDLVSVLDEPAAGDNELERLETLIASVLSSPHFLYRRELGVEATDERPYVRWLDDHEIATRLSFLVWQSGPDDQLLAAAEANELSDPEVRLAHLQRMLDDPRARVGQLGFVYDWLGVDAGPQIDDKDPEVLDGTPPDLTQRAATSLDATVQDVLFDGSGTLQGLLSVDHFLVDGPLASVLGLPGIEGDALMSAPLDAARRRGILMHPSVLAAHSKESGSSPFTIGLFVYRDVLCETIGAPGEIPPFAPDPAEGGTLREQLEALTEPAECQVCHERIGPPGFAFSTFDPIGRHFPEDGLGRPFDTSGTIPVGGDVVAFDNAPELVAALAEHDYTARCLSRRAFRWTYGYFESPEDRDDVEMIEQTMRETDTDFVELLAAIVQSDSFAQVKRGEE